MSALAVLLAFVGLACEAVPLDPTGTGEDPSESVSLVVEPESADVSVGDTVQLEARVVTDGGQEVSGVDFAWSVSDPEVASVDDAGELVGLAQGNVDVTVEATLSSGGDQSLTGGASVAVLPRTAASVSISPSSPSVQLGDTLQLTAAVTDENGEPVEQSVEWASSDTQVASVDADGTLVGRAEGEASISARTSSVADTAGVSVELTPAAAVEVSPSSVTLGEGETTQLEATVQDESGSELDRSVAWSSSNTSVATVDPLGQVQAQVEGEATIIARSGEAEGTAQVVVEAGSSAVPEMPTSATVSEVSRTDTNVEFRAEWEASDGADSYSWSAGSNSGVWNDSGSGVTTLEVTFTAPRGDSDDDSFFCVNGVNDAGSSENGCNAFTVPASSGGSGGGTPSDSIASVVVSPGNSTLSSIGSTRHFSAEAQNDAGDFISDVSYTWTSSNTSVATVAADGTATAQGDGMVQIIAEAEGVADSATLTVDTSSPGGGGSGSWTFRQNEPAGYTQITHDDFDNENGEWSYQTGSGDYSLTTRADEPDVDGHGADGVYRAHYLQGGSDGSDFSNAWKAGIDGGFSEFYAAYTLRLQEGWLNNTNETKHLVWFWGGEIGGTLNFDPDNGADGLLFPVIQLKESGTGTHRFTPTSSGFTRAQAEITRGEWHQIEMQVVGNTSNADKTFRVWLDGTLVIEEMNYSAATEEGPHNGQFLKELKFSNTYGGGGQSIPQDQHIDVGHVYVSGTD